GFHAGSIRSTRVTRARRRPISLQIRHVGRASRPGQPLPSAGSTRHRADRGTVPPSPSPLPRTPPPLPGHHGPLPGPSSPDAVVGLSVQGAPWQTRGPCPGPGGGRVRRRGGDGWGKM
ncbi:MAG: hypothetical protein AVDCRST_MAG70-1156, partial [uncultured Thermomicrobiales bacterium]